MVSEAQAKAIAKYEAKTYDRVSLRVRKDAEITRDMILKAAEAVGESLNEYVLNAVAERMRKGS